MDVPFFVEFFFIGLITGILSGLFGVGGGFILVPLLVFAGVPIHLATGTSLAYVTCTSMAGAYTHFNNHNIHLRTATFLIIFASLTLITVGIDINRALDAEQMKRAFAFLLIATAIYFFLNRSNDYRDEINSTSPQDFRVRNHWITQLVLGSVIGLLSGVFGVGGGFLLVPALVLIVKMPIKLAVGTSLFVIIFSSVIGTLTHAFCGNINLFVLLPLIPGGIVGAFFGANIVRRISAPYLQNAFIGLLVLAALYMFYAAF